MCNISDNRDTKSLYGGSHYFQINNKTTNSRNSKPKNELLKQSSETLSSPKKNMADVATSSTVTSVVKSSKVGDPNDNEETAHFVFFDMED